MHTIFETDCFVLKSYPSGESNKLLDLFTRDFGMIRASAQGLRKIQSKLRYSLTDFSITRVSLIRGKEFWRIATAIQKNHALTSIQSKEGQEVLFRIFALLRRLLQGEEAHPELFDTVLRAFNALSNSSIDKIQAIEELTVLRILFLLGYVGDDPSLRTFIDQEELDDTLLSQTFSARKKVIAEINRALKASHL